MKRWADWSLKFFYWAPSFSQIYGELHKLEELGLVASRLDDNKHPQRKRGEREKRVYRITPDGERAVTAWTTEAEPEPAMLKHGIMLRTWLGHTADPAKLREMVLAHRAQSERMRVLALDHAEGAAPVPEWAYPVAVLQLVGPVLRRRVRAGGHAAGRTGPARRERRETQAQAQDLTGQAGR